MENQNSNRYNNRTNFSEVNLKLLFKQLLQHKWLFAISLVICLAFAYVYIKLAIPLYEVKTTILIDSSGKSRQIGESKYIDGEVGLIGTEKNLNNEMAILKSYSLVNKAISELDFGVSYYSGPWYKQSESYNYFPFIVEVSDTNTQIYGVPFEVKLLPNDQYELIVEAKKFKVSNPSTSLKREVGKPLKYSEIHSFGEMVNHEYFSFKLVRPEYNVNKEDFLDKKLTFKLHTIAGLTNSYQSKLEVSQTDIQTSILRLKSTGSVLKKEKKFLNKLTEKFILSKYLERDEIASSKENFIQNQLILVSDSLAIAERNLEAFKRGANAVDLTKSASNALDKLQQLETELGQITLYVKYYYSMLDYIDDPSQIDKIIAPSVVGIDDPLLNENLIGLKTLIAEYTTEKTYLGKESLDLQRKEEEIAIKTRSLKTNLNSLIQSSELAQREINKRIRTIESTINKLPNSEKRLLNFERSTKLLGNLFDYLSQELAKAGIARAENIPDTKVLDEPRMVGDGPVSPQKKLIMALGGLVGLMLPFFWVVFKGLDEENIKVELLDSVSNILVLANIDKLPAEKAAALNGNTSWLLKESFRNLSASLQFLVPKTEKNIIGISSKKAGEGKTICAINLSMEFVEEGKRVLLIDLNFRKPGIAKVLGEQITGELSGYLTGKTDSIEDILYVYKDQPLLHFIPTLKSSYNPNHLIMNARLETLIKALKHEYDYIVIDSPAFGLVSDYLLISKYIDIHLFILRKNYSKLSEIASIENLIAKGKMKHSYLIFNGYENRSKAKSYPID